MSEPSTSLNSDILLSILSISSPKTATSIMATCHFLYHEGAKFVLQHPVSLDGSEKKAISLLRFIQAEDFSRCSYVRTLNIVADPVAETVAEMLAGIAPRMSNLVRLYFRGEQSLEAYPYLLPAFASLQSVKTLTIAEARAQSCELLKTLQSELISATIVFGPASRLDSELYIASRHPLHLLQRSASTLQDLVCGFWSDSVLSSETLVSLSETTVYPNVSNLVLYNNIAPSPISYIGAFPNLTHLRAETRRTIFEDFIRLGIFDAQRRLNLMVQGLFHEHWQPFVWQKIQTYSGPLSDLWALGMSFPIPRLILTDVPTMRYALALTEVLADARPIHLTITFEDQPFSSVLNSDLLDARRSDGASGLRSLALAVDVMAGDVDGSLNIDRTLTCLQTVFSGLHLNELQLAICDITPSEPAGVQSPIPVGEVHSGSGSPDNTLDHGDAAQVAPRGPADGAPSLVVHRDEAEDRASFTLAESTLEDVDVHAFVRRLSTSIPTLKNAIISIGRPRRCGGAPRTRCLGECHGVSEAHIDGGVVHSLCEELQVLELERISREQGFNVTWASLSRAWQRGVRGANDAELLSMVV